MLKPSKFHDIHEGIDTLLEIIESNIEGDVKFWKDVKEKKRRKTWYLDTTNFTLNKRNKFLLRIRMEKGAGDYETTLKCRHPDRYLSASYDLSSPKKNLEIKFEEDISIPFISKFSLSASFTENKIPELNNFKDLKHIFPKLDVMDIHETDSLNKVNNFEPNEISYKIGTIKFTEKRNLDLYLNLWYLKYEIKEDIPLIVEFTFDYGAKEQPEKKRLY